MTRTQLLISAEEIPPATREAMVKRGIEISKVETPDDALELEERENLIVFWVFLRVRILRHWSPSSETDFLTVQSFSVLPMGPNPV